MGRENSRASCDDMCVKNILVVLVILLSNIPAVSAADGITRRDGFLLLWQSIHRPVFDVRETPFTDVSEGDTEFQEITYAKNRGVLDDELQFHPDDALTLGDALLWLYRTRNVMELPDMQKEHLRTLMDRYPIVASGSDISDIIASQEELLSLTGKLDALLRDAVHEVSMYGEEFHGDGTAFGEIFDMHAITAAHRSFPHNTLVKVTNIDNDKSVTVRINDRGPFKSRRIIDLSRRTAQLLGFDTQGVTEIRVRYVGLAPIDPRDDRRERQHLAAQPCQHLLVEDRSRRAREPLVDDQAHRIRPDVDDRDGWPVIETTLRHVHRRPSPLKRGRDGV